MTFNSMRGFFASIAEDGDCRTLEHAPSSTTREKVYREHPSVMDLWRSLKRE